MSSFTPPPAPSSGDPLAACNPCQSTLNLMAQRRSTPIRMLSGPGPDQSALDHILRLAARAPDHRKIEPWRFIVISGDHREKLGEAIAGVRLKETPEIDEIALAEDRGRFLRAPVCVTVISSPNKDHKTPVFEQELSAGAVCMNLLLAANAMGWAASWLSEWCAFSRGVDQILGLNDDERIAGFIYLGTALASPPERPRPDMSQRTSYWSGA